MDVAPDPYGQTRPHSTRARAPTLGTDLDDHRVIEQLTQAHAGAQALGREMGHPHWRPLAEPVHACQPIGHIPKTSASSRDRVGQLLAAFQPRY